MSILRLHIDEIDIFIAEYDDISGEGLSVAQRADLDTISNDKRRRERALTYTLINHAALTCTRYMAIAGTDIGHRTGGEPFLKALGEMEPTVNISISHCRTAACIAFGDRAYSFGIDIEDYSERLSRVAGKFINDREKTFITPDMLLCAWTIKEATYKAASIEGLTLREGIDITEISPDPSDNRLCFNRMSEIKAAGATFRGYTMTEAGRCTTLSVRN